MKWIATDFEAAKGRIRLSVWNVSPRDFAFDLEEKSTGKIIWQESGFETLADARNAAEKFIGIDPAK